MHVAKVVSSQKGRQYVSWLLRHNYRDNGKVKHRTLANLTGLPEPTIAAIAAALKGTALVPATDWQITRSLPHGNVVAVLGTLRALGIERMLDRAPSRTRNLVVGMIASRLLHPSSKLAMTRTLSQTTLGALLDVEGATEDELYRAMDWLEERQGKVEKALAKKHLANGSLVLYDLSSSYMEGTHCPLAHWGYSRDQKRGKTQIEYGLLTDVDGRPVAVEVFAGNTSDSTTVSGQIEKLRKKFGLNEVIVVGDRGMITGKLIDEELGTRENEGISWITALRHAQISDLEVKGAFQLSLFDEKEIGEIRSDAYPNERIILVRNDYLKPRLTANREELLVATEELVGKIALRVQKGNLVGRDAIGLAVGKVINARKVGKFFDVVITDTTLTVTRKTDEISRAHSLDGIYALRTSVSEEAMPAADVVRTYKKLQHVEQAFRHFKAVDLQVRPIHHYSETRVRAHLFLCMLAYYVQWEMERCWAPMTYKDDSPTPSVSPVTADRQASPARSTGDQPVHSYRTLLSEMATLTRNTVTSPQTNAIPFDIVATPTTLQAQALTALSLSSALA